MFVSAFPTGGLDITRETVKLTPKDKARSALQAIALHPQDATQEHFATLVDTLADYRDDLAKRGVDRLKLLPNSIDRFKVASTLIRRGQTVLQDQSVLQEVDTFLDFVLFDNGYGIGNTLNPVSAKNTKAARQSLFDMCCKADSPHQCVEDFKKRAQNL